MKKINSTDVIMAIAALVVIALGLGSISQSAGFVNIDGGAWLFGLGFIIIGSMNLGVAVNKMTAGRAASVTAKTKKVKVVK